MHVLVIIGLAGIFLWLLLRIEQRIAVLAREIVKAELRIVDMDRRVAKRLWELSIAFRRLSDFAPDLPYGEDREWFRDLDEVLPYGLDPDKTIDAVNWREIKL